MLSIIRVQSLTYCDVMWVQMHVLDVAAKGQLSDDTMSTLLTKLFGPNPMIRVASPGSIRVPVNGEIWTDDDALPALFFGASTEQVLVSVNCNLNHWCVIMIDLEKRRIYFYDPMESTYKVGVRSAAEHIKNLLRVQGFEGCRVQSYGSHLGVQTDNYNCGIYVLVACEVFAGAQSPGLIDKKTLQYLRYRYLSLCI